MPDLRAPLRDRPVFICGHPKSGTSLLSALLDSHPQLVVYPEETLFFRAVLPQAKPLDLREKIALAEQGLIHIFHWRLENPPPHQDGFPDRDYTEIPFEMVEQAMHRRLAAEGYRHEGDLLSAAVLAFGEVTDQLTDATLRWVEKSTYNEQFADRIYAWWPEARCIHIVRDPRDNFLSYHRKHPEWSSELFASSWLASARTGIANRRRYGKKRYLVIRYEDLTCSPAASLLAVRKFLEIADHPTLRTPTRVGKAWEGNSMFSLRFNAISAAAVGRWKQRLSRADLGVIEIIAGSQMEDLGYARSDTPSVRARLRALKWRLRRALSSWRI